MVLANRVRSYLSAAFNYGIRWKDKDEYTRMMRFDITMNPVSSVDKPLKEEAAGERTLSEKEIKRLWGNAANEEFDKFCDKHEDSLNTKCGSHWVTTIYKNKEKYNPFPRDPYDDLIFP